jgi:hypothetical protein
VWCWCWCWCVCACCCAAVVCSVVQDGAGLLLLLQNYMPEADACVVCVVCLLVALAVLSQSHKHACTSHEACSCACCWLGHVTPECRCMCCRCLCSAGLPVCECVVPAVRTECVHAMPYIACIACLSCDSNIIILIILLGPLLTQ